MNYQPSGPVRQRPLTQGQRFFAMVLIMAFIIVVVVASVFMMGVRSYEHDQKHSCSLKRTYTGHENVTVIHDKMVEVGFSPSIFYESKKEMSFEFKPWCGKENSSDQKRCLHDVHSTNVNIKEEVGPNNLTTVDIRIRAYIDNEVDDRSALELMECIGNRLDEIFVNDLRFDTDLEDCDCERRTPGFEGPFLLASIFVIAAFFSSARKRSRPF